MRKTLLITTVLLGFMLYRVIGFYEDRLLRIYFLNVGQGDSILIRTPDYKFVLIDGGPDSSVLSELGEVMPFWLRKIDAVILTHPDLDHLNGLNDVIRFYEVGKVFYNVLDKDTLAYNYFVRTIGEKSLESEGLQSKDDFKMGCCVEFDVLWPDEYVDLNSLGPTNNTSISVKLIYGDFEIILAGDIESAIEDRLAHTGNIKADLLKINHHGSNTSSTEDFLDAVGPETAIISAGKDNKFGHPTEQTLDRLNERAVRVYRTDVSGRISVETNGMGYRITCEISCPAALEGI